MGIDLEFLVFFFFGACAGLMMVALCFFVFFLVPVQVW